MVKRYVKPVVCMYFVFSIFWIILPKLKYCNWYFNNLEKTSVYIYYYVLHNKVIQLHCDNAYMCMYVCSNYGVECLFHLELTRNFVAVYTTQNDNYVTS